MTPEQIQVIAEKASEEALQKFLLILGVDTSKPEGVLDLQKDFLYTREARLGKEELVKKGKLTLVGAFIMAILALLVNGFFNYHPGQ